MLRSTLLRLSTAFFILFLCSPSRAATLEDKVREHQFANGLRLLVVERHASPTFAAYLTIGVGAVDENSETRGVAHLLEHMLFKGTKTLGTTDYAAEKPLLDKIAAVGGEIDRLKNDPAADRKRLKTLRQQLTELQKQHRRFVVKDEFSRIYAENGGTGYNAFTTKDSTTYLISLPSNKLELWALIESDRMKNAVLREFYTERDVIQEERRRSYESNPGGMLYETLIANAYTVHPYRNPIIGWHTDIANLTLAETREFHRRYYAPINTVIALVGDIDFDRAVAMVERYFGDIPPGTRVPPLAVVEPPQKGEKRIHIDFDAQPQMAIAYHKPTLPAREDYVFDLIDLILSGGPTSRLYKSLVQKQQLATRVSTYGAPGARYDNLFVISAAPRYPHTLAEVEQAIYAELERLTREPVSETELDKARNRLKVDHLQGMQSNNGLARSLTYFQTVAHDWRYLARYQQVISSITASEIMQVAKTYLTADNRTVVTLSKEETQP
ncbi:insulinase family protein [Geothermobacter hydrogeniphilus]|uniref:Insulinase family protein n=1 Tax=Geothermobacter hydrogeniphilus TaxID=1969733 RepID=A0A2K2H878_9BACT|nr:pitrilysin family protein [Geothermobacter hydrogeniphilus]PNU19443.1 insulinase family protein [Geothermobacter hydrogeniphilus]